MLRTQNPVASLQYLLFALASACEIPLSVEVFGELSLITPAEAEGLSAAIDAPEPD